MSKIEIVKRYTLFVISLFFAAVGVAFTKHGELCFNNWSNISIKK